VSIATALTRFRAKQAEQFSQTCTVHRPVGEMTYDPDAQESTQPTELLYTGLPCKVTSNERAGSDVDAGETEVRLVDMMVKFPIDTDVAMNDVVTITASTYHPLSVGKQYRILDVDDREWQISRRCTIEETLVPMSWEGS
jgi:hypothetical protein